MTALSEYKRLESQGLWREAAEAQRRDVMVALGGTSLVIVDPRADRALSHWSLPAIRRVNPGERPARFAPGEEPGEELEISDDRMIAAIGKVRALVEARRPHPGRLRYGILAAVTLGVLGLGILWVPGALIAHTAGAVPAATRTEIGQAVLADVFRLTGAACAAPEGRAALDRLGARLLPDGGRELIVVARGLDGAREIPGGYILLGRNLVEGGATPAIAAGHVLAEATRADAADPLLALLDWAGVGAAFQLLTTGSLAAERIGGYAETLMAGAPGEADPAVLAARLADAGVAAEPYIAALGPESAAGQALAGAARAVPADRPILSDNDWVALQGICGD